jgi:hypothetical protein
MNKIRKVDARKQRDPLQQPVLPGVSTRSVSDEHPVPEQFRIRQDSAEISNQPTAFPVNAAVHSCSVCGKRLGSAYSLR